MTNNRMKRITLFIFLVCCALTLSAQVTYRVNYQGAKPTISDFVTSFAAARVEALEEYDEYDESFNALRDVWERHLQGKPLEKEESLIVDERNGYVCYERGPFDGWLSRYEMCFWNESDGRHKVFAYCMSSFQNDRYEPGQYDGISFYRYDSSTRQMTMAEDMGFPLRYGNDEGDWLSYALPRTGKDITVTTWYKSGPRKKLLKWNGRKFSY